MPTTTTCTINSDGNQATLTLTLDSGTWGTLVNPAASDLTVHVDQRSGVPDEYYDADTGSSVVSVSGDGTATATVVIGLTRRIPRELNTANVGEEIHHCQFSIPAGWLTDGSVNNDAVDNQDAINNSTIDCCDARFTRPDCQEVVASGTRIGVVAKCYGGIASVNFYDDADDTLLGTAVGRIANPGAANYPDHGLSFNPADFADGAKTIRAVIYPNDQITYAPRTLRITMYANSGGSQANTGRVFVVDAATGTPTGTGTEADPTDTINNAAVQCRTLYGTDHGLTIQVKNGNYRPNITGSAVGPAVVVEPFPGHSPTIDIDGDSSNRHQQYHVIYRNLNVGATFFCRGSGTKQVIVLRNCVRNTGSFTNIVPASDIFLIECTRDGNSGSASGMSGSTSTVTAIGCTNTDCSGDQYSRNRMVLNCRSDNCIYVSGQHPDGYQSFVSGTNRENQRYNTIIDGLWLEGELQGLFFDDEMHDAWFENVVVWYTGASALQSQIGAAYRNLVMLRCTLHGQTLTFNVDAASATGCVVEACSLSSVSFNGTTQAAIESAWDIDNNHFISGANVGTNGTTGDAGFVDAASGNFAPDTGSPLLSRYTPVDDEFDIDGTALATDGTASIGALQEDTTAPSAPTGLQAAAGDGQVVLTWTDPADSDLDSINVYRGTTSGNLSLLTTVAAGVQTTTDATVTNGTTYHYAISADDGTNESAQTAEVSATPASPTPKLSVDAGNNTTASGTTHSLSATVENNTGRVQYEWRFISQPVNANGRLQKSDTESPTIVATKHGKYVLEVVVTDTDGSKAKDKVEITFEQTKTSVFVTPRNFSIKTGQSETIYATLLDQFGNQMDGSFTWTVPSGSGTVDNGSFTAPETTGLNVIRATESSGLYDEATANIVNTNRSDVTYYSGKQITLGGLKTTTRGRYPFTEDYTKSNDDDPNTDVTIRINPEN